MNALRTLILMLALPVWGAAGSATVSRVDGELVEIRDAGSARVGDTVEILTRLPGFDELAKVGSGRVLSVFSGGLTARIAQRSGALAVGQEARLSPRSSEPMRPGTAGTTGAPPASLPSTPPAAPGSLERELNDALRQSLLERVSATVGPNREITLRGTVTSTADKLRVMEITRGLAQASPIKYQVFVVEP